MYVVNRDSMGKFSDGNVNLYQEIDGVLPNGVYGAPAFFNNTIYYGSLAYNIQAFSLTNGKLSTTATAKTPDVYGYPGQHQVSPQTGQATVSCGRYSITMLPLYGLTTPTPSVNCTTAARRADVITSIAASSPRR